ncbi:MAG TPA: c-type cytochrome [Myxococcaceae bacterium]|nr:c-type cytochrome [Myxococcaceae bacterium]
MASMRSHGCLLIAVLAAACSQKRITEPYPLTDGKSIDVKTLNDGYEAYMLYCYGCHGEKGDGSGPASLAMRPPPRNFTRGLFKFAGVEAGKLPVDDALDRTIRRGLNGTPMLPWDVAQVERRPIIQYLKTLSPRWQSADEYGTPIEISADPWRGKDKEAIARGKQVYHVAVGGAGCSGCHAAYATRQEISEMTQKVTGEPVAEFPENMYAPSLRESEYPLEVDEKGEVVKAYQILPPDFLVNKTKSAYPVGTRVDGREYTASMQREDLYRTIGAGIGGAAMPQWKGALPEESLWSLVYYVQTLVALRDTPEGLALRRKLDNQPPWTPPAPPPEPAQEKGSSANKPKR